MNSLDVGTYLKLVVQPVVLPAPITLPTRDPVKSLKEVYLAYVYHIFLTVNLADQMREITVAQPILNIPVLGPNNHC
jgi:hypothetical protein